MRKDADVFGAGQCKQKHISCFYERTVSRRIQTEVSMNTYVSIDRRNGPSSTCSRQKFPCLPALLDLSTPQSPLPPSSYLNLSLHPPPVFSPGGAIRAHRRLGSHRCRLIAWLLSLPHPLVTTSCHLPHGQGGERPCCAGQARRGEAAGGTRGLSRCSVPALRPFKALHRIGRHHDGTLARH